MSAQWREQESIMYFENDNVIYMLHDFFCIQSFFLSFPTSEVEIYISFMHYSIIRFKIIFIQFWCASNCWLLSYLNKWIKKISTKLLDQSILLSMSERRKQTVRGEGWKIAHKDACLWLLETLLCSYSLTTTDYRLLTHLSLSLLQGFFLETYSFRHWIYLNKRVFT